jgi:hypothetical protein
MVYVDLPETDLLRVGMFVSGELLFPATVALHVPESALVFRDGFQYVMKLDGTNRVRRIKISTGRRMGQAVEILGENLTTSDRIVRSGGGFLDEGDTVQVVATPATAANADAAVLREYFRFMWMYNFDANFWGAHADETPKTTCETPVFSELFASIKIENQPTAKGGGDCQ